MKMSLLVASCVEAVRKHGFFYPKTDEKVPVISFAHGAGGQGEKKISDYKVHHGMVAAAGFVLIHFESGTGICSNHWKDQLRSLEFLKNESPASLSNRIDWSRPTGIMGHSMGGGATYHSAAQSEYVERLNIGAAVAYHGGSGNPGCGPSNSVVPIMFTTGSSDTMPADSPAGLKKDYTRTTGVPKVFANLEGAGHMEPCGKNRLTPFTIAMMDCHLRGDSAQCTKVYGSETSSLCAGGAKMKECMHENGPALNGTASLVV